VTMVWKISIHVAVAGGTVSVLVEMYGSWALVGVVAVLLVAWSRLILTHHTVDQVMAGAAVGVAVAGWVFGAHLRANSPVIAGLAVTRDGGDRRLLGQRRHVTAGRDQEDRTTRSLQW